MRELEARIKSGEVIIFDGGIGTELERRNVPMNSANWCGAAMFTHTDIVRQVHEDYILSGVDVITTNSFGTARHMLTPAGLEDRFEEINQQAVEMALQARDRVANRPVMVAGSISPIHFDLDYAVPVKVAADNYGAQANILADAGVDLIAIEMIWDIDYSLAAVEAAIATGLPVWLGFTCREKENGQPMLFSEKYHGTLESALEVLCPLSISAVNVMHTLAEHVSPALEKIKEHWSGTLGVYAHSGEFKMPRWQFANMITPEDYATECLRWVEEGAQIIGGCCGIGPEYIRLLPERLPTHMPGVST